MVGATFSAKFFCTVPGVHVHHKRFPRKASQGFSVGAPQKKAIVKLIRAIVTTGGLYNVCMHSAHAAPAFDNSTLFFFFFLANAPLGWRDTQN
jgi:hypothetical protein